MEHKGINYELQTYRDDILLVSPEQDVRIEGAYADLKHRIRREYAHEFIEHDESKSMDYDSERVDEAVSQELEVYAAFRFEDGIVFKHDQKTTLKNYQRIANNLHSSIGYVSALGNMLVIMERRGIPALDRLEMYAEATKINPYDSGRA